MTAQGYDHVIVGAGMAGDAAARGIREVDPTASVLVVGREPTPPVARPPLTKGLWTDPEQTLEGTWLGTADDTGAELALGVAVTALDPAAQAVTLADGRVIRYGSLLLATSGHPRRLPGVEEPADRVLYYRTVTDYERLRALAGPGQHVVVVGGGYVGTEIAAALATQGTRVTLVFPEPVLTGRVFPDLLAQTVERSFAAHGVELVRGQHVRRTEPTGPSGEAVRVHLDDGTTLEADAVVVGAGLVLDTDLARDAGLDVTDGIEVDAQLRTSAPHVWAAGDVARYPDPVLGRRRVEHEDQAVSSGHQAGRNMAGAAEAYTHTPSFYSDLFDAGYEAVGRLDASLETVEVWHDVGQEGVVYYVDGDRVVGVLLWNVWDAVDAARDVLAHQRDVSPAALRGLIGPPAAGRAQVPAPVPAGEE